jgi:aryl-alcohol dehydrogenase-like predicted oxidoreductase
MTAKRTKAAERPTTKKRAPSPSDLTAGLPMGPDGPIHPRLGFGLWAMGRWTNDDETRTRIALERAVEHGIRWLDTAEVYGNGRSERLLGDILARIGPRSAELLVVSKVSWEHLRASQLRAALTSTLHRLGRPSLPLYLVHAPDPHVPITETMGALETLRKEGKIGAIGVSNFDLEELEAAEAALSEARVVVNQVRYNLFERADGDAVLEHCKRRGIVVEAYTPLFRGLLAGRFLDSGTLPAEVRRFSRLLPDETAVPEILGRARQIRDLAKEAGVPMASIALHWLARRGVAILFGASRPEQVDAVIEAFGRVPKASVLDEADRIALGQ